MKEFIGNIETLTLENTNFRNVLYTGHHLQLVAMSLKVWEEIWSEIHHKEDQFFRIEHWQAKVIVGDNTYQVGHNDIIIVPAWEEHNVINTGDSDLKLYTIYSPKHHEDGTIHATKAEADAAEEDHH